jgi:probable DNA metabolism protein
MCDDTIECIFTAIYDAWDSKYGHENIRIEVKSTFGQVNNIELFAEYIDVIADNEKANKVANSINKKISLEAYEMITRVALSDSTNKGDIIYRFLILGFKMGPNVVNHLTNDAVINLFNLSRNVGYEAHHFLGFIRFTETKNNILLTKINPKNDILRIIAPHFSDRLQGENFVIYDEKRKTAIVHLSHKQWFFTNAEDFNIDKLMEYSDQESDFRQLWQIFFDTIAIKERENYKLQRNNLPIRFRSNITEFNS